MKAISTRYHGPTNTLGSRITADDGDGNRLTVNYNHALDSTDAHAEAACALIRKMKWVNSPQCETVYAGATKDGYVFVFPVEWAAYDVVTGERRLKR